MAAVGVVLIAAVAMLLVNMTTASAVAAAGSTLVTLLLGFVSRQLRIQMKDVEKFMDRVGEQARNMR